MRRERGAGGSIACEAKRGQVHPLPRRRRRPRSEEAGPEGAPQQARARWRERAHKAPPRPVHGHARVAVSKLTSKAPRKRIPLGAFFAPTTKCQMDPPAAPIPNAVPMSSQILSGHGGLPSPFMAAPGERAPARGGSSTA